MVSNLTERVAATGLEVVGIVIILFGVLEIGVGGNPFSPEVLLPAGSVLIAAGSILWAKILRY